MTGGEVEIVVNGESRGVAAGTTLEGLLREVGHDPRTVAVEHNGEILPRARYGATVLQAGDRLEIVRFVQGGVYNRGPRAASSIGRAADS